MPADPTGATGHRRTAMATIVRTGVFCGSSKRGSRNVNVTGVFVMKMMIVKRTGNRNQ